MSLRAGQAAALDDVLASLVEIGYTRTDLVERRRKEPGSDLISAMVAAEDGDDRLTDLSPEGYAAQVDLDRQTLAKLDAATPETENVPVNGAWSPEEASVAVPVSVSVTGEVPGV